LGAGGSVGSECNAQSMGTCQRLPLYQRLPREGKEEREGDCSSSNSHAEKGEGGVRPNNLNVFLNRPT